MTILNDIQHKMPSHKYILVLMILNQVGNTGLCLTNDLVLEWRSRQTKDVDPGSLCLLQKKVWFFPLGQWCILFKLNWFDLFNQVKWDADVLLTYPHPPLFSCSICFLLLGPCIERSYITSLAAGRWFIALSPRRSRPRCAPFIRIRFWLCDSRRSSCGRPTSRPWRRLCSPL